MLLDPIVLKFPAVVPKNELPKPVGSYQSSPSPYGTLDQAGNIAEWIDRALTSRGDPSALAVIRREVQTLKRGNMGQ